MTDKVKCNFHQRTDLMFKCLACGGVSEKSNKCLFEYVQNEKIFLAVLDIFCLFSGLEKHVFLQSNRGVKRISTLRQLLCSILHTEFGFAYEEIGYFLGRDRTTVSHACEMAEKYRCDETGEWKTDIIKIIGEI